MKTAVIIILFCFISYAIHAQTDSIINLKSVNIEVTKYKRFNNGLKEQAYDSLLLARYTHTSLTELLSDNSAIYLKSYGPGALSTLSMRGGSAYQTATLWNGFSLASPLNGVTDLSLLKNFLFEDVNIQYGGSSAIGGSGAVSGTLQLNNKSDFKSGIRVYKGISANTFSTYGEQFSVSIGLNKYYSILKLYNQFGKNNYTFYDPAKKYVDTQINSRLKQYGILNEHYFILSQSTQLNFRIWKSFSDRLIPPSFFQSISNAYQIDKNLRLSAEAQHIKKNVTYSIRSAYFKERQVYNDDFILYPSDNTSNRFINEATCEINLSKRHLLQSGFTYSYSYNDSTYELSKASLSEPAFSVLYRYSSLTNKIRISLNLRKEFSSLNNPPFTYTAGINYLPISGCMIRSSVSRVFRNPTLNDLYWRSGGNPNLKPETGYSYEASTEVNLFDLPFFTHTFSSHLTFDFTGYYKKINNWIAWYPFSNYYWKPENLLKVNSHGFESGIRYLYTKNRFSAGAGLHYFYTKSSTVESLLTNDASIDKQLIYVPLYSWNINCFITYASFGIYFNRTFAGYRYTTSDNSAWLEPYSVDNIRIEKSFQLTECKINVFIRSNNLFNTNYELIKGRPMPQRSLEGGLSIAFHKLIK